MAWRKPEIFDIAATLNQRELDLYRAHPDFKTDEDPVLRLILGAAEYARGYIREGARKNRRISMSPRQYELPESLIIKVMDYAAYDILKRLNMAVGDDRKAARERAEEFFAKVAEGFYTPEPYADDGQGEGGSNGLAMPKFGDGRRKILNEMLY